MSKLTPGDRVTVDAGLGITKTGNVQRITESTVFVKHYNGAVVGYKTQHVTKVLTEQAEAKPRGVGLKSEFDAFAMVMEKKLTPAELEKREEIATAMERENPGMDKSKKMAIATAAAKRVAEEAEQIDEISKKTLGSYVTKASDQATMHAYGQGGVDTRYAGEPVSKRPDDYNSGRKTAIKRLKGISKAVTRLTKESAELEEGFENLPGKATHLTNKDVRHPEHGIIAGSTTLRHIEGNKYEVRAGRAKGKMVNLDKDHVQPLSQEGKEHTVPKTAKERSLAALASPKDKITHADVMVGRGVKKEELELDEEQLDEVSKETLVNYAKKVSDSRVQQKRSIYKRDRSTEGEAKAHKRLDKTYGEEAELDEEQLNELSKGTLASYAKKAAVDAKFKGFQAGHVEGDAMARSKKMYGGSGAGSDIDDKAHSRLRGVKKAIDRLTKEGVDRENMHYCAKHVFSERFGEGLVVEGQHAEPDAQGLIEWYDVDFGGTVRRVMTEKVKVMHAEYHMNHKKKMSEEGSDEGSHAVPKFKGNEYHKLAVKHLRDALSKDATPTQKEYGKKMNKRALEAAKISDPVAAKKHYMGVNESVELDEAMISYSDFQSKIDAHKKAGNKIKDDKYDKKKASYTVIDQEGSAKKITHTDSGVSQQHLGSVKRDDDESSETETRGRGRPAGSKSGARN